MILIYHRVHAKPDPMFPGEASAETFDWQMALLRRYCNPVPLLDGVRGLQSGNLPERAVTVTFDDGYADNAEVALPILGRHAVPAAFFVATGYLNGGRMWNDSIIEAVRRAQGTELDLADLGLERVSLGPEETRGPVAELVIRAIKHRPPAERQARVDELCGLIGAQLPDDLMMNDAQVRQLAEAGMEVGAHTVSHPILLKLSDEAARAEIEGSRQTLQAITGVEIRAFAYPNGKPGEDYTHRDRDVVESLGFETALSTTWGAASAASDRFQLPRFTPWDRTPSRWLARLLLTFGKPA
jgi:peptidoglycan/xylan/chitin deacetylase (PgdA/CDA1 family)